MCATCILSLARLRQCCCCLALTGYLRRFGSTLVPMAGIWYGLWDGMAQQNHGKCTHHHQVVIPVRMCMLLVGMDGWMDMDGKCSFFLTVSCARSPPPPPATATAGTVRWEGTWVSVWLCECVRVHGELIRSSCCWYFWSTQVVHIKLSVLTKAASVHR